MPVHDTGSEAEYGTPKEKLLAEIRDRYDYALTCWQDIREEARTDMLYCSGNPWPESERLRREQAGRPCLVMDELSQYTNALVNDIRQNKRAVKVVPRGYGANDQTAELRGDLIREIEYKSNAQSAYACGFENMCNRSYGGWKIVRRYVNEKSFDQEIRIVRIPNPDSSIPDPDCKELDYSDAKYWFLLDLVPRKEYKKRYPKATITDFDQSHTSAAPNWIKEDQVQVAEYWRVETTTRKLHMVDIGQGNMSPMFDDELPENFDAKEEAKDGGRIKNTREVRQRKIMQYITNGVEILEENEEPGNYIPIVWLTGKELYVDDGGGSRRVLMSLIRLARDPQMMVNYLATCESEVVGMTPKVPYIGAKGQFHKPEVWQVSNTQPVAFLEYDPQPEGISTPLGPPTRQSYEPQVQQLELAREACRRSIQASMGLSALPTNAQRLNDKSGVALKQIDANEDRGSFHFIDNYEMALEYSGRIINDKIPHVYDGAREVGLRNAKDEHRSVKINQEYVDEKGQKQNHDMTVGEHEITISTGPDFQSEREARDEFIKTIVPELEQITQDPAKREKLAALLVKASDIGPAGDEIAEILDPKEGPNQLQAQLTQATQQSQQYQQMLAESETKIQNLELEKKAKVIDNQAQAVQADLDRKVKLEIAQITAKSQNQQQRDALWTDLMTELHSAAHDAAMTAIQQAHEKFMAQQQAANAQQTQASDQAHQQQMATQPVANGNGAGA
jgi:Phage P22-like portal protein